MIVVADSGPLHYLILLEQVDLLRRFYGQVLVPQAVADELSTAGAPVVVREWITRPPSWVEVLPVASDVIAAITDDLDLGERSAIALAETLHADLLERLRTTSFYLDETLLNAVFGPWLKR
jgi:predicted nucleic acid-binding protein